MDFETETKIDDLAAWILYHVNSWEEYRDTTFKEKWEEYYRLWRGIWSENDKTRNSERSKLISPALSQAIEVAVSEQEEAVFGRGRWFDVSDDVKDENDEDIMSIRNLLTEDLDESGIRSALSEIFLNGAIYGTGIGKLVVEEMDEKTIQSGQFGPLTDTINKITVKLLAVNPMEFAIDPLARSIKEAMGMSHNMIVPKHVIIEKQRLGIYKKGYLGSYSEEQIIVDDIESKYTKDDNKCRIVEYHGLVPKKLFDEAQLDEDEELADLGVDDNFDIEEDELIEAIVTIANDRLVLKSVENPYMMGDRCFMSYQHDTVPNRFWGRGIAEKGYNPQKALDAELRGRIDAMALAIHPMVGVDSTKIPRGENFSVRPGRTVLTTGDPRQVLMPFNFGAVSGNTFPQAGELERMIQMGTGSMDSATGTGSQPRNQTASGMSMIQSGAIKRSKRTMANIEENLIEPLVHKAMWRYMQFDPDRYPIKDVKFIAYSTLGIMARELEQSNLANLMKTVPADSPAYWMLIRSFYENSAIFEKERMLQVIDGMMDKILNPQPDPVQQQVQALELQSASLNNKKTESEIMYNLARAQKESQDNGSSDSNKAMLNAELKVMLEKMGNDTDKEVAMINAQKEVKIKEMELKAANEAPIQPVENTEKENIIVYNAPDKEKAEVNKEIINYLNKRAQQLDE